MNATTDNQADLDFDRDVFWAVRVRGYSYYRRISPRGPFRSGHYEIVLVRARTLNDAKARAVAVALADPEYKKFKSTYTNSSDTPKAIEARRWDETPEFRRWLPVVNDGK